MKLIVFLILLHLSFSICSQNNLSGRFFYSIDGSYRDLDSSIIDADVWCHYFDDSLMYTVHYTSNENKNYFYYNTDKSIIENIKWAITNFFSFREIEITKYEVVATRNLIGENIQYVYLNQTVTDSSSASYFVCNNQLFSIISERWIWENGKMIKYPNAPKNEFYYANYFLEFDQKYVKKYIGKYKN
jgi:hypothetical protein